MLTLLLLSCNDETNFEEAVNAQLNDEALLASTIPIESYPLDWENIDFMPHPGELRIRVPWQAGASANISDEMLHDYKKEDGWELVYNTFHEEAYEAHMFFTLYNKYRGVVRTYRYTPSGQIHSSNTVSTLSLRGNVSSPILNFADQPVVDVNKNSREASMITPFKFAGQNWYAFEYELAYDDNLKNLGFTQLSQQWEMGSMNIISAVINGNSVGTISGTIKSGGKNFLRDKVIEPGVESLVEGVFSPDDNSCNCEDNDIWGFLGGAALEGVKGALSGGIAGAATNLLSGVFGLKNDNTQYVNLDINTEIQLEGELVEEHSIGGPNIPFPGYGSSPNGIAYDKVPGVFYLTKNPEIRETGVTYMGDPTLPPVLRRYDYRIIEGSYEIKWNPDFLQIADVEDITTEIVNRSTDYVVIGEVERIGADGAVATGNRIVYEGREVFEPANIIGVRFSFKVRPKNGDPEAFIVKTFKADVTEKAHTIIDNGGGDPE